MTVEDYMNVYLNALISENVTNDDITNSICEDVKLDENWKWCGGRKWSTFNFKLNGVGFVKCYSQYSKKI